MITLLSKFYLPIPYQLILCILEKGKEGKGVHMKVT